ncbi:anti-sigma factor RsbA family regulatory protein [Planosporangium sp. 12N6]|uniref:anti-sigma factor RsbA family regulatory protein n=1 Tax=Planosporangium spinosum TaxID=3402278 RepID=UPI003CF05C13
MTGSSLIHQALIYHDAQQFLAAVLPFIEEGLNRGEPVLAVTTETNSVLLRGELGRAAAQVQFVEPARWYDAPGRTIAACHRYVQERRSGQERVRVIGEPVWNGWSPLETSGWKRFEAGLNVALAAAPAWMICSYDERLLAPDVLADARRTHPQLSDGKESPDYGDPAELCTQWQPELPFPPAGSYAALAFDGDPAPVRRFVVAQATRLGVPPGRLDDLILAVNEVATNAIRHGAGGGQVRIWRDERYLLCEVFDRGRATKGLFGLVPPSPDSEGGHGLWITRQLCDLVEIRSDPHGTTVRLYIRCA